MVVILGELSAVDFYFKGNENGTDFCSLKYTFNISAGRWYRH